MEFIDLSEEDKKETQQYWFFTFGIGHPLLSKHYVKIYGTYDGARAIMLEAFGTKWCMQYNTAEEFRADKWGIEELPTNQQEQT